MVREINTREISDAVRRLSIEANEQLGEDVLLGFQKALKNEVSPVGKEILTQLIEKTPAWPGRNRSPSARIPAWRSFLLEIGQEVHLVGGDLKEAVNQGVRAGTGRDICESPPAILLPGPIPGTTRQR